jgi:hypothetical protein
MTFGFTVKNGLCPKHCFWVHWSVLGKLSILAHRRASLTDLLWVFSENKAPVDTWTTDVVFTMRDVFWKGPYAGNEFSLIICFKGTALQFQLKYFIDYLNKWQLFFSIQFQILFAAFLHGFRCRGYGCDVCTLLPGRGTDSFDMRATVLISPILEPEIKWLVPKWIPFWGQGGGLHSSQEALILCFTGSSYGSQATGVAVVPFVLDYLVLRKRFLLFVAMVD